MGPHERAAMERFIRDHPLAFDVLCLFFYVVLPVGFAVGLIVGMS